MKIRKTIGKTERGLIKAVYEDGKLLHNVEVYEDQDGEHEIIMPLSTEELVAKYSARAVLSYTNKDGKVYYTQTGDTKHLKDQGDYVSAVHVCLMGDKKEKSRTFFAIWEKAKLDDMSKTPFPVAKFDLTKDEDLNVLKIIQSTKFAFNG